MTPAQAGDCFFANGLEFQRLTGLMQGTNDKVLLVHGAVIGSEGGPIAGLEHMHCWVEIEFDDDESRAIVISVANGDSFAVSRARYYEIARIAQAGNNVHRYDMAAFRQRVLEHGHWGPWDLVTSTGL